MISHVVFLAVAVAVVVVLQQQWLLHVQNLDWLDVLWLDIDQLNSNYIAFWYFFDGAQQYHFTEEIIFVEAGAKMQRVEKEP